MKRLWTVLVCALCLQLPSRAMAQAGPGTITTIAGTGTASFSGDGGPAAQAALNQPERVVVDDKGNVYISDFFNGRIRRISPDGIITTFAGGGSPSAGSIGDGGPATQARLVAPVGLAIDASGNVYLTDDQRVRRVGTDGAITTVAGSGPAGLGSFSGDGGPATQARLNTPSAVAVDAQGNVYIADLLNNRIRRVGLDGTITTFAGSGTRGFSGDGGPATQAQLGGPIGVATDASGNVYIADQGNNRIRRVGPDGTIMTFAGNGTSTSSGPVGDGKPATQASLLAPRSLAVDIKGNVYIAEDGGRIRRVGPDGIIVTVAGKGTRGFSGDGGPAIQAALAVPRGVAVDANGVIYIADTANNRVRRVEPGGQVASGPGISLSPSSLEFGNADVGSTSQKTLTISNPGSESLTVTGITASGADAGLFKVSPTTATVAAGQSQTVTVTFAPTSAGAKTATLSVAHSAAGSPSSVALSGRGVLGLVITTFAGTGPFGFLGDGGPALQAGLNSPRGVAVDASGNVYIADMGGNRVRRVGPDGIITTFAGTGAPGFSGDGGPAAQAALRVPQGVAVDANGNVYIADVGNYRVRRVGTDGVITTIAGSGTSGFSGDGGPATQANLSGLSVVAVEAKGNVYLTDGHRVRRVGTNGFITTFAGSGTFGFSGDGGPATQAAMRSPSGVAVDASGNVYIADTVNHRIRRVGADGVITTVVGKGTNAGSTLGSFSGDGGPALQADLASPSSLAFDAAGTLYISDTGNGRIRRVGADGIITTVAGGGRSTEEGVPATQAGLSPSGLAVDAKGVIYVADMGGNRVRRVGQVPAISLSVTSLTFDSTKAGETSQKTFTISNPGNEPLSITAITVTDASQFKVSPTKATVAVGNSETVTVTFAPITAGTKSATLSIAHNAPGSPTTISLKGTGFGGAVITTFAGTGTAGFSGDGGPANKAGLNTPFGVAVDAKGNVYIADTVNNRIRRVRPDGNITTFVGTGEGGFSGDGGPATQAKVNFPHGVAVDSKGAVYIADKDNGRVRRVGVDGVITTVAGGGTALQDNIPATQAAFQPFGVAVDTNGVIYFADQNGHRVYRVGVDGIIKIIAGVTDGRGRGVAGFSGDGGPATRANLRSPFGVAVDAQGNVYIGDTENNRVRRVGVDGIITTFAGGGNSREDGVPATQVVLSSPSGVAVDAAGAVYIAEEGGSRVRRVGQDGGILTIAGTGKGGFSGEGGPATQANLLGPVGVAVDTKGNLYIAENANHRVRKVEGLGVTGGGTPGGQTGGQTGPSISVSASSLTFDNTNVGATSQKTLTISNTGNASLSVTGITVTGTNATEFKASPTSGTVEAGKSLTVTVTFAPASVGAKTASLSIAHNATGSPATVALVGSGVSATTPSTTLTPKAGDGTGALDLDVAAGDQSSRTLGGVKPGQKVDVQVLLNKEFANAAGFQVVLKFDPKKLSVTGWKKDGTAFASAIDLPAQVKADSVIYGASILGGTTTASKGAVAVLTFQAASDYSGDTEITLQSLAIRVSGAFNTLTPGASVALSSGAVAGGGPSKPTPDFDGDGEVGFNDFFAFAGAFGQKATGANAKFDLDGDGDIGFGDFFLFAGEFGKKLR